VIERMVRRSSGIRQLGGGPWLKPQHRAYSPTRDISLRAATRPSLATNWKRAPAAILGDFASTDLGKAAVARASGGMVPPV
jgi:hypothetical protein